MGQKILKNNLELKTDSIQLLKLIFDIFLHKMCNFRKKISKF